MKLIYLPLEPYVERYTYLMSKPGGWAEDHFKKNNVDFIRVEGTPTSGRIGTGSVVDAYSRSRWAMQQVEKVVNMIEDGTIKDEDVIYTEDFWHPGIEALFYIRGVTMKEFMIGCFMHAQSIDESDFTHSMKYWMADMERGMARGYDWVFVTSDILKNIATKAGWPSERLRLTGLPFNKSMLVEEYGHHISKSKKPYVLFSSRFDSEKNPHFFLDLVERCNDIQFKLVQPRAVLSNSAGAQARAFDLQRTRDNFAIIDTSNKDEYYRALGSAAVQFNCAIQDWVSWTLIEAVTFGCKPLYPRWKDFPYELRNHPDCLYDNKNLDDAEAKLRNLMRLPYDQTLHEVADRHDKSWSKKLMHMEFIR